MQLNDYQEAAAVFAQYPNLGHPIVYPALGLAGEAGEVAEKVKKLCRDDELFLTDSRRQAIMKELGDVLWYLAATAREAGLTLEEVAIGNIEKLTDRHGRGVMNGSGDDR